MMRVRTGATGLFVACVLVSGGVSAQPVVGRDSAGIRIVEVEGSRLAALPTWTVEGPTVTIGEPMGEPEYLFNRVGLVWRLADGRIVVPNEQVELRFYDASGKYLRTVGRRGRGPGEYTYLLSLWRTAGDTLRALDANVSRVDVRNADGELIRSHSIEGRAGSSTAWLPDGRALYLHSEEGEYSRVGLTQHRAAIRRMGADGVARDTVASVPSWWWLVTVPGRANSPTLAGGPLLFGGAGGAVFAHGDEVAVHWFSEGGQHAAISRVTMGRTRVTDADRRATEAAAAALRARNPGMGSEGGPAPRVVYAEFRPMLSRIRLDAEGRAWVRRWTPAGQAMAEWIVFERHGAPIARVMLPAEFLANDIGRDYLLGPATDADGVQSVRLYRLVRPASPR